MQQRLKQLLQAAPYRFPRIYDLIVQRGIFGWLGMSGQRQTAFVRDVIRRSGHLLETPIGTGSLTLDLYAQRPDVCVVGVDLALPMVRHVRRQVERRGLHNVHVVCANMMVLPFRDDVFSQIVTLNGLQVVPRYEPVVDELLRVAQDGMAIVGTASVEIGHEPRGGLHRLLTRVGWIRPIQAEALHELLGLTWSKLQAQRSGAMYRFWRPALDRMTGELLADEM